MELVEHVIDEDPALDRKYRVPGSPTFVLVDTAGRLLIRFHYEATQTALEARLKPYFS